MPAVFNGHSGANVLLIVLAIVLFVLAAFGVHSGTFTALNVAEFGLAAFAASFLA